MDTLQFVRELIDEAQRLNASAPAEANRRDEFITKMTASVVLGSLAKCLLNATKKSGALA